MPRPPRLLLPLILGLVLGLAPAACSPDGRSPISGNASLEGIVRPGATDAERLASALKSTGGAALSFDAVEQVKRIGGAVASDSPGKVSGLPAGTAEVDLLGDAALTPLLDGTDENALADALLAKGAKVVLVQGRASASVSRGRNLRTRLYHHDQMSRFALFRVGANGEQLYQVLEKAVSFPPQVAELCFKYIRARIQGARIDGFPDLPSETKDWTFSATLRGQGKELVTAFASNRSLQGALEELITDLERIHRRDVELLGFPHLAAHLPQLTLELRRVTERATVEPRDEDFLNALMEPGIDGAYLLSADGKERGALPGSASYTRALISADSFLREAAKVGNMSERRPWRDAKARLEIFRDVHYMQMTDGPMLLLYRGVPQIPMSGVTLASVRAGIIAGGDWYLQNMGPEGQVIYKYWPHENRYSNEYNIVRHTLATWNLVQAWTLDQRRTDFLVGARKTFDFTQKFVKTAPAPDGQLMAYYEHEGNIKLGTTVVQLLGLVELAKATQDKQYDELLRQYGRFILFMQAESGTFRGYHVPKEHPYYNMKNDIVPGEAALALIMLADYFNDDSYIATLPKFWEYFQTFYAERSARVKGDMPWPAYIYDNQDRLDLVQFGPWTVMAANAYYRRTKDEKVADFGLTLARWMIESYQWDAERAPYPDYVGGYYKFAGELPAMQAFCYGEGTSAAYQLALQARPDQVAYFEEHSRQTVRFGLLMQADPWNTYPFSRPEQVDGGIRYAMNESKVRIDYSYHAYSAMYQWYQGALSDPNLAAAIKDGPMLPMQQVRDRDNAAYVQEQMARLTALQAEGKAVEIPATPPLWLKRGGYPVPYYRPNTSIDHSPEAWLKANKAVDKTEAGKAAQAAEDKSEEKTEE